MTELESGAASAAGPETTAAPSPEATATEAPVQNEGGADDSDGGLDSELRSLYRKANPERAPDGRFSAREAASPAPEITGQKPEVATIEQAKPAIDAPISWSAEQKAKWNTFSPDAQAYIAQREKESSAKISELGQKASALEPVSQVLEQHRDLFEARGMTYQDGVGRLFAAQRALDRDPASAIMQLAQSYGVDLAALYGSQSGNQPSPALLQELNDLRQQVHSLTNHAQSREQRDAQTQWASMETALTDFLKDKPDFNEVADDVADLIPVIRQKEPHLSVQQLLAKAYEKAGWANEAHRSKRLAAEQKAVAERAAEEAKKKAADAKKAASINVRSGDSSRTVVSADEDAELREVYRRSRGV